MALIHQKVDTVIFFGDGIFFATQVDNFNLFNLDFVGVFQFGMFGDKAGDLE